MRKIGPYEIVERWSSRGPETVYRARGGDGREVRLLVFEPTPSASGEVSIALASARLLESARLQKEAGGAEAGWAGVLGSGRERGRVWVATETARATLAELVEARFPIDARTLRPIAQGIIRGLASYHERTGRCVGNLRARSVLIERVSGGSISGVKLTDPGVLAKPRRLDPSADVATLGRMLWRVVEGKGETTPAPPEASATPAWKALGRSGERWRAYVNALLDPRALERGSLPDLGTLEKTLPIEPYDWSKPALGVAGVAALVAIGGGVWWQFFRGATQEELDQAVAAVAALCAEYEGWLDGVRDFVVVDPDAGLARFRAQDGDAVEVLNESLAYLEQSVAAPLRELEPEPDPTLRGESIYDPLRWAPAHEGTYAELAQRLQKEGAAVLASAAHRKGGNSQLRAVAARAEEVRVALASWPTVRALQEWSQEYRTDRGWEGLGGDLQARTQAFSAVSTDAPAWGVVRELLEGAAAVERLEVVWTKAQQLETLRLEPGRASLRFLRDSLNQQIGGTSSADDALVVLDGLEPLLDDILRLAENEDQRIRWDLLAASDDLTTLDQMAVRNEFRRWLDLVRGYERLDDDPRKPEEWAGTLARARAEAQEIREFGGTQDADRLTRALDDVSARVAEVGALAPIRRDAESLAALSSEVQARVESVSADAERTVLPYREPPAQYIARQRGRTFRSPALNDLWQQRLSSSSFTSGREPGYREFFVDTGWLEQQFDRLDDPSRFARPTPPPLTEGASAFDREGYLRVATGERERAVAEAGASFVRAAAGEGHPSGFDELEALRSPAEAGFRAWESAALGLVEEALWVEARLDEAYRIEEATPEGRTIAEALDTLERGAQAYPGVVSTARGVIARAEAARAVAGMGTLGEVRAAVEGALAGAGGGAANGGAGGDRPALLAEAWRWLTDRGAGEPEAVLALARRVREALEDWASRAASGERGSVVRAHLASSGPEVWVRAAQQARARDVLARVAQERSAFGVEDGSIPGDVWWRVRTIELVDRDLAGVDNDGPALDRVRQFVAEVRARPDVPGWALESELFAAASELARGEEPKANPEELGPAVWNARDEGRRNARQWVFVPEESDVPQDGRPPQRLVYRYERPGRGVEPLELRFHLVPTGDGRPILLSETEVSIGVASQAIETLRRSRGWRGALTNPSNRVRTWSLSTAMNIAPARTWIPEQRLDQDREDFARGYAPSAPNENDPMQNVGAHAAMAIAQQLGCRLPTPEEFRAALTREYGGRSAVQAAQAGAGNLRRAEWRAQFEHAGGDDRDPSIASVIPNEDDGAWPGDDGVTFFMEVGEVGGAGGGAGVFKHLIGNVAEWVIDPSVASQYEVNPDTSLPDVMDLVGPMESAAGVIGQSAFMPPTVGIEDVLTRRSGPGGRTLDRAMVGIGYTDVGFRLAMAPQGRWGTVREWLAKRLDAALNLASR